MAKPEFKKIKTNEQIQQNRRRVTDTENKQVVARGEEVRERRGIGEEDQEVQTSSSKINESQV